MTLQADLQALLTDSATWSDTSLTLSTAATSAAGLWLGTSQLSWAAEVTGLTQTYADFVDQVAERLRQGRDNTAEMAGGLKMVHAEFVGTDGSVRNDLDGQWDAMNE